MSEAISDSLNGPHSGDKVGFAGREAIASEAEGFCASFEFLAISYTKCADSPGDVRSVVRKQASEWLLGFVFTKS